MADNSVLIKTILFDKSVAGNIVCFEQLGKREVGYWLGKEYWGKGIATRALEQFLKQVVTRPLYAHVAKNNIGSRRVLEKCGFTFSGEDGYFSEALGKSVEEYILILNTQEMIKSSFQPGDKASRTTAITDEMIRLFAGLTGDTNPVHLDDAYAAGTRFGRRIAHGMIAAGPAQQQEHPGGARREEDREPQRERRTPHQASSGVCST